MISRISPKEIDKGWEKSSIIPMKNGEEISTLPGF
jgi:hypothetical protein